VRRPDSKLFAVALRRGWVVLAAVVLVTALAAFANSTREGQTVAEAVAIVPAGAGEDGPGDAVQATQLAQTYLEAIPLDDAVTNHVAQQIDRPLEDVEESITVVGNPETSVLRLQYEDSERERALTAAGALLEAVAGREPLAQSVAPGSLNTVREPSVLRESSGGSTAAIPIGVFLGLCLGLVLAVAWERSDPRIDRPEELADVAGTPATAIDDVAPGNIGALLERWRRLAGDGSGAQVVGLLAGTARSEGLVRPAANELAGMSAANGHLLRVATSSGSRGAEPGLLVVTGGVPGGPAAGEAVAADASVVVVAVERGARATELRGTLAVLEQFGAPPAWALLTERQGAR
jgi:capsular polysaccharide biosynthesis protein